MLELLIFVAAGAFLGIFTGLVPGIHVNTVVIVILSVLPVLLETFGMYPVIALIISISVVHSFVDFIPSILLGAPEEDSVLSILPGHRLLLNGRGYEAIRLTVMGGLGSVVVGVGILPLGLGFFPVFYRFSLSVLPVLLGFILVYMVLSEIDRRRKGFAVLSITFSGCLGFLVLDTNILDPEYVLFPTLTGLFGMSTLLVSLRSNPNIPPQTMEEDGSIPTKGIFIGPAAGILAGLVPSMGSSQSAILVQKAFKDEGDSEFLAALGGVNTTESLYAFLALFLIGNPRSGASIAVERIFSTVDFADFLFMVGVVLVSASFATPLTLALGRVLVPRVQGIDYSKFSLATILFLLSVVTLVTGPMGVLILATATAIGLIPAISGAKRSTCMAVLILPTLFYFL
jgi:putative membrane protein